MEFTPDPHHVNTLRDKGKAERRDEENPSRRNKRRKCLSCGVLVIDELGFQTMARLLHHCHVVDVDSSSYRLWEMEQRTRTGPRKEV
jgi:hypothetical protein